MNKIEERIKLAQFMGWKFPEGAETWAVPPQDPRPPQQGNMEEIPDPRTNPKHCEDLMQFMVNQDFAWCIEPWPGSTSVALYESAVTIDGAELVARGDFKDWKHGICELAIKAIDND